MSDESPHRRSADPIIAVMERQLDLQERTVTQLVGTMATVSQTQAVHAEILKQLAQRQNEHERDGKDQDKANADQFKQHTTLIENQAVAQAEVRATGRTLMWVLGVGFTGLGLLVVLVNFGLAHVQP